MYSVFRNICIIQICIYMCICVLSIDKMCRKTCTLINRLLWLIGSVKLLVSFAKDPYKRDYILQKRPIILRCPLIVATLESQSSCAQESWLCSCARTRLTNNASRCREALRVCVIVCWWENAFFLGLVRVKEHVSRLWLCVYERRCSPLTRFVCRNMSHDKCR